MQAFYKIALFTFILALSITLVIGGFYAKRYINYKLSYERFIEDKVTTMLCDAIKEDMHSKTFKNPSNCHHK
ncbi:hypothetical protein AB4254_08325 [Vibrio breoganii]